MIFQHTWQQVLDGTKTQTRRVCDAGKMCKYDVGKTYSVQPGRGKKGVGRIRILGIHNGPLQEISEKDARAEGCRAEIDIRVGYCREITAIGVFHRLWDSIQPAGRRRDDNPWVWVIEFELVKAEEAERIEAEE